MSWFRAAAAIAILVFLNQRKKATGAGMKSDLRTIANEMKTFYTNSQAYGLTTFTIDALVAGGESHCLHLGNHLRVVRPNQHISR